MLFNLRWLKYFFFFVFLFCCSAATAQAGLGDSDALYRFWSNQNGTHFYTISEGERDYIIANYPEQVWQYEGKAYYAYAPGEQPTNAKPVYRFWSDQNQAHFYTIYEEERSNIIANYLEEIWRYEAIAYYAFTPGNQPTDTKPVYRFWSDQNGTHFYTISEEEKNNIIATYSEEVWRYEGIAWYAMDEQVEFGTVVSAGQVWMDRNLVASRVATSFDDSAAYGALYQWGRGTDGHQKRPYPTPMTSTLSTTDNPGHGEFISEFTSPYDWRTPQNDNLWQGISGINNPCPDGFRLPTITELDTERASWNSQDPTGAFASPLKLVAGGFRSPTGFIDRVGNYGAYWSSSALRSPEGDSFSGALHFYSNNVDIYGYDRAEGYSVRCIKDVSEDFKIFKTLDSFGNVIRLISNEEQSIGDVHTVFTKKTDGGVDVKTDITTSDNKSVTFEFSAGDSGIMESSSMNDKKISIAQSGGGYDITIPKQLMHSWKNSNVQISSYGKGVQDGAITVIDDDPRLFFNSGSVPLTDYVLPIDLYGNGVTGNQAIVSERDYYNLYALDFYLKYQIQYHANYSKLNSSKRNVSISPSMVEENIIGIGRTVRASDVTFVVSDISDHTSGVDYFVGPKGWYAQDSKTKAIFDWDKSLGNGKPEIGYFNFTFINNVGVSTEIDSDYEFYATIDVRDGELDETYNGDWHFNKKINYKPSSLQITSPSSDSVLSAGGQYKVKWKVVNWGMEWNENFEFWLIVAPDSVPILLGSSDFTVDGNPDYGEFQFTVPDVPQSGNTFQIQMQWNGPGLYDVVGEISEYFSITSGDSNSEQEYGTVTSSTGQVWMDRNLGASRVAKNSTDSAAYGDLYQWGRGSDGHELRTSDTTSVKYDDGDPVDDKFIIGTYNWRTTPNDDLWKGADAVNNPCPPGFRVPTQLELKSELESWPHQNADGAWNSKLKLVTAGSRGHYDAQIYNLNKYGMYWSNTYISSYLGSGYLSFNSQRTSTGSTNVSTGLSVRCLMD